MTDSTNYADLIDHSIIGRARALHDDSIALLREAERALEEAKRRHGEAEAAANLAAAGEGDVSALAAEHALNDATVALASAGRVHAAAVARHARTYKNIGASESVAWRPVGIDAGRRRLAACEKFDRANAMLAEADAEYLAAAQQGQAATAHRFPSAEFGLSRARAVREERLYWNAIRHAVDIDAGTFAGPPNGYIA